MPETIWLSGSFAYEILLVRLDKYSLGQQGTRVVQGNQSVNNHDLQALR